MRAPMRALIERTFTDMCIPLIQKVYLIVKKMRRKIVTIKETSKMISMVSE